MDIEYNEVITVIIILWDLQFPFGSNETSDVICSV